jgi:hypothetical protein
MIQLGHGAPEALVTRPLTGGCGPRGAHHYRQIVWVSHACVARPTGVGRALTAYRMPIEGRDEWIAAVERLA